MSIVSRLSPFAVAALSLAIPTVVYSQDAARSAAPSDPTLTRAPWLNSRLDPDTRATALARRMSQAEKIALIQGENFGLTVGKLLDMRHYGLPLLFEADAPLGIANSGRKAPGVTMPVNIAVAATWDLALAEKRGRALAEEARGQGIAILLTPAGNLMRDPRGGRTNEYLGEDPVLAGRMMAATVNGIQASHVLATVKHFGINGWESQRKTVNMQIDDAAARESDLLAFEIAIRESRPAAVMCAYPWLNGLPSCASRYLLEDVLRGDWHYRGFVMSDWDAFQDGPTSANAGLDVQSGVLPTTNPNPAFAKFAGGGFNDGRSTAPPGRFGPGGVIHYYGNLQQDIDAGRVTQERLDTMVHRILRSIFAVGAVDFPPDQKGYDLSAHRKIAQQQTEDGAVLIKNNDRVLPLTAGSGTVALIGRPADGIFSKPNSAFPYNPPVLNGPNVRDALAQRLGSRVRYDPGNNIEAAVKLADKSDTVIIFADMPATEGADLENLSLASGADALIERVAQANPNTIVVLAVSNPPIMPWANKVRGILVSWQLGDGGGEAVARLLTGEVNPSGKLPITFPSSLAELPRPIIPGFNRGGLGGLYSEITDVPLIEGGRVGYKWYNSTNRRAAYSFGEGLSYTTFAYGPLTVTKTKAGISASVTISNAGARAGKEVVQIYAHSANNNQELVAFKKVALAVREKKVVSIPLDRRRFTTWDTKNRRWVVKGGDYVLTAGSSDIVLREAHIMLQPSIEK